MDEKMKKKNDHTSSFLGQKVNVVTKLMLEESQQEGETMISNNQPLVFAGILIDYDDSFYFVGDETGEVKQIISKSEVVALQIDPDVVDSEEMESDKNLN
jgi:hypothetical protein